MPFEANGKRRCKKPNPSVSGPSPFRNGNDSVNMKSSLPIQRSKETVMKLKNILTLIVLGMCGGTIFLLPYLKYVFYNQMIAATGLNGQDLGFLVAMYAFINLFVLLPGGILADRLSSKWCIFWSLISTSALTVVYAFTFQSYVASLVIWGLLAVSTIFVAWAAIMKTVRAVGAAAVGTAYSIYYAANGLTGAGGAWVVLTVYEALAEGSGPNLDAFFWSVISVAAMTTIVPFILLWFLRDFREHAEDGEKKSLPTLKDSIAVLKMPKIWLVSIVLFSTYTLYLGMTFFTPYLSQAFGISDQTSGMLTTIRSFVFMSLTPLTGIFADKIAKSTLKWFLIATPLVIVPLLAINWIGNAEGMGTIVIILTMVAAFFVCSLYASMFSIVSEVQVPISIAGTAIGLVSIFSYTPDIVMQPLFGHFVDQNNYGGIFLTLAAMAALAAATCALLLVMNRKTPEA